MNPNLVEAIGILVVLGSITLVTSAAFMVGVVWGLLVLGLILAPFGVFLVYQAAAIEQRAAFEPGRGDQ